MATSATSDDHLRPVERFKPTGGQFLGYAGIAAAAVAVGYVALYVHTMTGLRVAIGAVFFGLVTWVTQVRPRATAYPRHVVLKNSVRDAYVPFVLVDEVAIGQTLNVWVGDQRFVCIGIGQSIREDLRARRRKEDITGGGSRLTQLSLMAERASTDERAMSYQTFVVTRLEELVEKAKKEAGNDEPHTPARHVIAWPEIAALAVAGLAFVVSFFV
jgi:hypothetical protein